jgi:hypothetical protein
MTGRRKKEDDIPDQSQRKKFGRNLFHRKDCTVWTDANSQ